MSDCVDIFTCDAHFVEDKATKGFAAAKQARNECMERTKTCRRAGKRRKTLRRKRSKLHKSIRNKRKHY